MTSSGPLKQEVMEQLSWLFQEVGFRIVEDDYDPNSFGNSLVTLESPSLRLRFIRDRGQVFTEIASSSDPETWWNLEHVCELISGKNVESVVGLLAAGALLKNNFPALLDRFGSKYSETRRELLKISAARRKPDFLRRC